MWQRVDAWNRAICGEFFAGQHRDQPVYLDLDPPVLARMAAQVGEGQDDPENALLDAVVPTLHVRPPGIRSLFHSHASRLHDWQVNGREGAPPFLAVLAFTCIIADRMGSDEQWAGNNYYGRLGDALRLAPGDAERRSNAQKDFQRQAFLFWDALNRWLRDNEGRLGLPTATAFDHRRHIGLPLSQVLLREDDRRHLADLFEAFDLRPYQLLSQRDTLRLMQDWVPHSNLSARARHLWQTNAFVRDRIADVARLELESWPGSARPDQGQAALTQGGKLRLVAALRQHPRAQLVLGVACRDTAGLAEGEYRLASDATVAARAAFEECGELLELHRGEFPGWMSINDASLVSIPGLLQANVSLSGPVAGSELVRLAHAVVVLLEDAELKRFTEVDRIELGTEAIVLAHDSQALKVAAILPTAARPGYRAWTPDTLSGVPERWVAFDRVQLVATPSTDDPNLGMLVPLSWTQVLPGYGFKLPGLSTWHTSAPPEIRVSSLDKPVESLVITCTQGLGGIVPRDQDFEIGAIGSQAIRLDDCGLPSGDYRAELHAVATAATRPKDIVASATFRLRSANDPRPVDLGNNTRLGHDFTGNGPWAALSAASTVGASSEAWVSGGVVRTKLPAQLNPSQDRSDEVPAALTPIAPSPGARHEEDEPRSKLVPAVPAAASCFTGAHHWYIAPARSVQGYYQPHAGRCANCGLTKRFPARPGDSGSGRAKATLKVTPSVPQTLAAAVKPIQPTLNVDPNVLFDAVCYATADKWRTFEVLAEQVNDAAWYPLETARLLSALGHIDLSLDPRTLRPESWSVAPPAILLLPGRDEAILAGHRSDQLIAELERCVNVSDGNLSCHQHPGSPDEVCLSGIKGVDIPVVCELVAGATGTNVVFYPSAVASLLALLPTIGEIHACLPSAWNPGGPALQKFDFRQNRWIDVASMRGTGAYRFLSRPARYGFLVAGGCKVADSRLVKYLAAAATGIPLFAYDKSSSTLACRLGAQLPGLYERAAVLCSGKPPQQLIDGTVIYQGIPPWVAAGLWQRLGPRGWSE